MKFIELFAGIGGFRYGLESVGDKGWGEQPEKEREHFRGNELYTKSEYSSFHCVYANEFNKYAAQIYERNYGEKPDTRDIREVKAEEIPDHDLLTAGFPCQAFSIAGKRGGFEDTRGTLFFEIARIAKQKQPRLLLLENVKGLLSHDKGKTFGTILNTLDELGYDLQWQVLNSKDFGVPQNRERVFIIGHLRGTSRPEVFPIGGDDNPPITKGGEQASNAVISRTLTATDAKMHLDGNYINVVGTLESGGWEKRHEQIRRVHGIDGISPTIPTGTGGGVMTKIMKNTRIRRLTPTECERLQGFPDGWTEGISDTQRYKCLGNAVTTNVVTAIARKFKGIEWVEK